MITADYPTYLQLAVEMSGRTYPPTMEQAAIFKTFITHHLNEVWETYPWPEVCSPQQEWFAPTFDIQGIYNLGDVVYYPTTDKYYIMIRGGSVIAIEGSVPTEPQNWAEALPHPADSKGAWDPTMVYALGDQVSYAHAVYQLVTLGPAGTPVTDANFWGVVPAWYRFISKTLDLAGADRDVVIGEFIGITQEDPRSWVQATPVAFATMSVGTVGALIYDTVPYAWIYYRRTPPATLSDDDILPARFLQVVALRAAATMLRTDGKSDQANEFVALAEAALQGELDKVSVQEGQTFRTSVVGR